jgi:feruloyl esterase
MPHLRTTRCPSRWPICLAALISASAAADDCTDLAAVSIAETNIVSATLVPAGGFTPPGPQRAGGPGGPAGSVYAALPAFCRVEAALHPTANSNIGIEVWLPATGWNGKLEAVGNGAWAGTISHSALATALAQGYAATSTDTGHRGGSAEFLQQHPDLLVDFAHRAVHEMAVTAKAVVAAFYERPAARAYFTGCSTGGRQALTAAQRYPEDFDGIVAGAAAYYPSHIQGMQVWTAAVANRSADSILDRAAMTTVNAAAIAACDLIDGVADGVIENPGRCEFQPTSLACPSANGGACLAPAQIETVRRIYTGPTRSDGTSIYPGLARGSESGWTTLAGLAPLGLALETFQWIVHKDPAWDWRSFDAVTEIPGAALRIGPLMDAHDPDIDAFTARGGKLLLYHGWSDPGIPPAGTIRYYDAVRATLGARAADASVRLFMVPGMGHCAGGTGTDRFDAIAALDRWIETNTVPDRIEAERIVNGARVRTRPLCAWPQTAVYSGSGSTDDSANFACR